MNYNKDIQAFSTHALLSTRVPQVNANAIPVKKETQGTEEIAADWKTQDRTLEGNHVFLLRLRRQQGGSQLSLQILPPIV